MEQLGTLADPSQFTGPIGLGESDAQSALASLRMMWLIRGVEERIGDAVIRGEVKCPCHLAIGQEAIAVGVSIYLRPTDKIFGTHRSHPHYLAVGGSVYGLFAEVLGKQTGCSKGMGGSMHLTAPEVGFVGSVPIVGGTIPIAVGAALAAKKDGVGGVAVAYFGDGAVEEGAFHESLNFASQFALPMLFVCENNLYSSHLHIKERQPSDSVARFATAHRINSRLVDGNDVEAVSAATRELVQACREGQGPGFLEAVTYRWRGHVGPREDLDVGVRRPEDHQLWKMRDPIARLENGLIESGWAQVSDFEKIRLEVSLELDAAWDRAMNDPLPEADTYLAYSFETH